jgi:hypothetical protein
VRAPRALKTHGEARERPRAERGTAPGDPEARRLLELQRTAGNAAVARLIAATTAPRRLARQVDAPEDEAVPLDQAGAAGSSSTLSLADIGSGLAVESYSLPPGTRGGGELKEVSITRRLDKHSATIQRRAATGERIASAEIVAKRGSGAFVFKMSEVLVSSYTVGSRDESETFTLNFAESSFEKR